MKARPEWDLQQMERCICSIPCECDRSCFDKTGRPLAMLLHEHGHSLKEGLQEKSKLAQHAYEEGRRVVWDEARILEIESNSRYRKYKELAHMACLTDLISQPSLDIFPIWIPFINSGVTSSQRRPVWCDRFLMRFFKVLVLSVHTQEMVLGVGTKWFHKFSNNSYALVFMDLVCWLGLLHKIVTFLSILVSGWLMVYHNFCCIFSCYLPSSLPGLRY
jgi:hypothetical protein